MHLFGFNAALGGLFRFISFAHFACILLFYTWPIILAVTFQLDYPNSVQFKIKFLMFGPVLIKLCIQFLPSIIVLDNFFHLFLLQCSPLLFTEHKTCRVLSTNLHMQNSSKQPTVTIKMNEIYRNEIFKHFRWTKGKIQWPLLYLKNHVPSSETTKSVMNALWFCIIYNHFCVHFRYDFIILMKFVFDFTIRRWNERKILRYDKLSASTLNSMIIIY